MRFSIVLAGAFAFIPSVTLANECHSGVLGQLQPLKNYECVQKWCHTHYPHYGKRSRGLKLSRDAGGLPFDMTPEELESANAATGLDIAEVFSKTQLAARIPSNYQARNRKLAKEMCRCIRPPHYQTTTSKPHPSSTTKAAPSTTTSKTTTTTTCTTTQSSAGTTKQSTSQAESTTKTSTGQAGSTSAVTSSTNAATSTTVSAGTSESGSASTSSSSAGSTTPAGTTTSASTTDGGNTSQSTSADTTSTAETTSTAATTSTDTSASTSASSDSGSSTSADSTSDSTSVAATSTSEVATSSTSEAESSTTLTLPTTTLDVSTSISISLPDTTSLDLTTSLETTTSLDLTTTTGTATTESTTAADTASTTLTLPTTTLDLPTTTATATTESTSSDVDTSSTTLSMPTTSLDLSTTSLDLSTSTSVSLPTTTPELPTTTADTTTESTTTADATTESTTAESTTAASTTAESTTTESSTAASTTAESTTTESTTTESTTTESTTTAESTTTESTTTAESTTVESTTTESTTTESTTAESTTTESTTTETTTTETTTAESTTTESTTTASTTTASTTTESTTSASTIATTTTESTTFTTMVTTTTTSATTTASTCPLPSTPVASITCNSQTYVYQDLAGYGALRSNARDSFGDTLGGFGSSVAFDANSWTKDGNTYTGTMYALPDRGWNTQGTLNYQNRIHKFTVTLTLACDATVSNPSSPNIQLTYQSTTLLVDANGAPTTGLDANAAGPYPVMLGVSVPAATFSGDGFSNASSTPTQTLVSIDAEGLVLNGDGSYWVSDEYGPYIYKFSAAGVMQAVIRPPPAYIPQRNGADSFASNNPPIFAPDRIPSPADPATGRSNNQGFEGLTQSPDGTRLYVLIQSALRQEGGGSNTGRRNARFLVYDLTTTTPTAIAEYVVPLPSYVNNNGNTRIAAQSEIHYISPTQFLVLARDSGAGHGAGFSNSIYRDADVFDITTATNIIGQYDATGNAVTGGANSATLKTGIIAATYCKFVDFNVNAQLNRFGVRNGGAQDANLLNEKWESLALLPVNPSDPTSKDFFLFSVSDNDFITQDGYLNGGAFRYTDSSGYNVDNQVLAFRVTLPLASTPLKG